MLEAAGWKKGADGIRAKGDVKLKFVYQTSVSGPRQKCPGHHQGRLHQGRHRPGAQERGGRGVLRQRRAANPDTYQKFWADMQMFTTTMHVCPTRSIFMEQFTTEQIAQKANKWASRNIVALEQRRVRRRAFKAAQWSSTRSSARRCSSA